MRIFLRLAVLARSFLSARTGNLAVTFALAAIPLTLAMGAGVDYARGLKVHSNMADALDAAGLAVGAAATKPTACSSDGSTSTTTGNGTTSNPTQCASLQQVAQQYFNANFVQDTSADTVGKVNISIANESVTLTVSDNVPTTFLAAAGRMLNTATLNSMAVSASSTVVWGQTKLWVSLVLDNSGSMAQSNKMTALKNASQQLLTTLQAASNTPGDVEAYIVPFTNEVNIGTATTTAAWITWSQWDTKTWGSATAITPPATSGPADGCPWGYANDASTDPQGCRTPGATSAQTTIASSGTTKGYICPQSWSSASYTDGSNGHVFMGCWTSVAASGTTQIDSGRNATCSGTSNHPTYSSSNCSCTGSGSGTICKTKNWTHTTWVPETNTALWGGCIADRTQNYDIQDTQPSGAAAYYADNNDYCPAATVTPLGYNWSSLSTQINNMVASGSTNQAIGIAHGWQVLTPGNPYSTPAIPANTSRYIILLSDGLNTQDRWYGNGSTESTTPDANIDTREEDACDAAKADGVVIYSLYVNINGSDGDSAPLSYCATDSSKYFVITTSSDISTDFNNIAQQITDLRVSK